MTRRIRWLLIALAAGMGAAALAGAVAFGSSVVDDERPITGAARVKAEAAALAFTGGGRVTATEVGDEDSYYGVEVTMPDGRRVDVQLDESFTVVDSNGDGVRGDEGTTESTAGHDREDH